jgi:hypothetical protein
MADGGLSLLIISSLVSAGGGLIAQKSAENAAKAQSDYQKNLLARKEGNSREALKENTKRDLRNKSRQLAQIRLAQAGSGVNTTTGTPLAVFGEMENAIDDRINEGTNLALDAIGDLKQEQENLRYGDKQRKAAGKIDRMSLGIKAATSFSGGLSDVNDRYGSNPFGLFK